MMFANIIIDISHEKLDRPFGYIIPRRLEDVICVGSFVKVPFGKGNREISGFVIEITDETDYPVEKMKEIMSVSKNKEVVTSRLIELAYFIKTEYGSTMNRALKTVIPVKQKVKHIEKQTIVLNISGDELTDTVAAYNKKRAKAKLRLINELKEVNKIPKDVVVDKLNITNSTLKSMKEEGVIVIESETKYRNPVNVQAQDEYDIVLNDEQNKVASEIKQAMEGIYSGTVLKDDSLNRIHLIHGITGSGKTEVYMELIECAVENGKEVIVLIPEIALTYQTVKRFTRKFKDKVSIINSKLSKGERYDQFERAKKGEVSIMIGPRSALFTPFNNLGLIIIDEEHEGSYKSDSVPKYNAIEVAAHIAETTNSALVLGSATPSLDSYYKAKRGEYRLHTLTKREKGNLADVHVVDLRDELHAGNKSIFSFKLQKLIQERLERKEQTMLFINRRGYAGFVSCRECGVVMKCPHCDVSLKAHNNGKLICHYCGYEVPTPRLCPKCGSKYIAGFGTGTQKVEMSIKKMFPTARVLRMDLDTTSKKGGHEEILSAFANGDADILVGTQMIVKGHDFPNVTLVGVLAADMSLYASDYSAAERTFQLLTQAAGRAGRGSKKGDVVIQTYTPDNYSIVYSKDQDYESFYREEIAYRKLMLYPPVARMTAILMTSKNIDKLDCAVGVASEYIKSFKERNNQKMLAIIGPADAGIARINDVYRKVIYLKHLDNSVLIQIKDNLEKLIETDGRFDDINVSFDFTPQGNY